ncbi:MAG: hypothetical protein H6869_01405 [Rhodospirillales bacterium]|nr:hypothetical protein [Rhodospirillales bacterium]
MIGRRLLDFFRKALSQPCSPLNPESGVMKILHEKGYRFTPTAQKIGKMVVKGYIITNPDDIEVGVPQADPDATARYLEDYKAACEEYKRNKPPPTMPFFP